MGAAGGGRLPGSIKPRCPRDHACDWTRNEGDNHATCHACRIVMDKEAGWYTCGECNYAVCNTCVQVRVPNELSSSTNVAPVSSLALQEGGNEIWRQVRNGKEHEALQALQGGLRDPRWVHSRSGQNLMFWAAARPPSLGGAEAIARRLAELEVPIVEQDDMRQTPLFYASKLGNDQCVLFLLEGSTDPNHQDSNGQTALFYAAREGKVSTCRMLVDMGTEPGVKDRHDRIAFNFVVPGPKQEELHFLKVPAVEKNAPHLLTMSPAAVVAPGSVRVGGKKTTLMPGQVGRKMTAVPASLSGGQVRPTPVDAIEPATKKRKIQNASEAAGSTAHNGTNASGNADAKARAAATWDSWVRGNAGSSGNGVATSNGGATKAQFAAAMTFAAAMSETGQYLVERPRLGDVERLRALEREFVQDHWALFRDDPKAVNLGIEQWCEVLNVIYDEADANRAISSIVKGNTAGHTTLQCVHVPPNDLNGDLKSPQRHVVGYIHFVNMQKHIDASHLKVDAKYQKRGLGGLLLAGMAKFANQESPRGISDVQPNQLHDLRLVVMQRNEGARRLYRALGFEECGTDKRKLGKSTSVVFWTRMRRLAKEKGQTLSTFLDLCVERATKEPK